METVTDEKSAFSEINPRAPNNNQQKDDNLIVEGSENFEENVNKDSNDRKIENETITKENKGKQQVDQIDEKLSKSIVKENQKLDLKNLTVEAEKSYSLKAESIGKKEEKGADNIFQSQQLTSKRTPLEINITSTVNKNMNFDSTNEITDFKKTTAVMTTTVIPSNDLIKQEFTECGNISQQASLIVDSILSPPKSETQTDETTNTSSPQSESHLSPIGTPPLIVAGAAISSSGGIPSNLLTSKMTPPPGSKTEIPRGAPGTTTELSSSSSPSISESLLVSSNKRSSNSGGGGISSNSSKITVANGSLPKSGKPLMAAISKKQYNKPRGRPKRSKALVAMYQSEISDNKFGIKLCIKKSSEATFQNTSSTASSTSSTKSKNNRKRSRKSKHRVCAGTDSEDSEYEKKRRKEKANNNTDKQKKNAIDYIEPEEQSVWGKSLPPEILDKIFQYVVYQEGYLPTLFRLGKVCTLWRSVSLNPTLWKSLDLSVKVKEKFRTELKLKWLIENRLKGCQDLNISNWKVSDIQCVLNMLADFCPDLVGITLAGWKGFTSDHLAFLVEEFTKLQRIDLSSINIEMNTSKTAVGLQALCSAIQVLNGRLTHLYLAHNRLAGIPQIVTTLATYCPNLVLLDLSNVRTIAVSHGILHVEKLQQGCQKLKVLRITNSHITLNTATLQEQMDSPGFPELEELSVASLANESRLINDEFLQRILKKSTKLNLLDVRGCARLTHHSLIRLPAWDLKHLFLSGCSITRDIGSGLELIASKWANSLVEFDMAWANVQTPLDNALKALAEKGVESPLTHLNLCGSSVSEEAVKEILANCPLLNSINLSSCRGLPRGVKRLMHGPKEIQELRDVLKVTLKVSPITSKTATESSS